MGKEDNNKEELLPIIELEWYDLPEDGAIYVSTVGETETNKEFISELAKHFSYYKSGDFTVEIDVPVDDDGSISWSTIGDEKETIENCSMKLGYQVLWI